LAAAERLAGRVGLRAGGGGKRDLYLCHTVCELGATKMVDSLRVIGSYMKRNPGEVVILFVEPYVPPAAIAKVFAEAGLDRYVVTLRHDAPLPTLGELVRSDRRLVVFTEADADGTVPWYLDGFSFIQDTPLRAKRRSELTCKLYRGGTDSPILMLNNWADVFPPQRKANIPFNQKSFILARARRCGRERGVTVNLIADDHYDEGGLVAAVGELNRERVATVAAERRRLSTAASAGG
jgi:hypothetical protein